MLKPVQLSCLIFCLLLVLTLATRSLAADEAKARSLINALGCKGCHSFEGSGGNLGPALDSVGKTQSEELIRHKLLEPKATNPNSLMPTYDHLDRADINALAEFLAAQKK